MVSPVQSLADFFTGFLSLVIAADPLVTQQATYANAIDSAIAAGVQTNQTSPPFYPSPWATENTVGWADAYTKAKDFVSQLTLLEKVNLTTGVGWEGEQVSILLQPTIKLVLGEYLLTRA